MAKNTFVAKINPKTGTPYLAMWEDPEVVLWTNRKGDSSFMRNLQLGKGAVAGETIGSICETGWDSAQGEPAKPYIGFETPHGFKVMRRRPKA